MKKGNDELESTLNKVIDLAEDFELSELEVQEGNKRVRIKRIFIPQRVERLREKGLEEDITGQGKYEKVTAPLSGIFYRAAAPQDPPYVEEGEVVEKGQTLSVLEAMKVFNEIKSEFSARIIKILVENGKQIEAGTVLFLVEPVIKGNSE